jgi:hypothetical protein
VLKMKEKSQRKRKNTVGLKCQQRKESIFYMQHLRNRKMFGSMLSKRPSSNAEKVRNTITRKT